MSESDNSGLGDRLLDGVRNLWSEVNGHGKILQHHGSEIEALKRQLGSLEKQVQGLKVSRGMARAKNARLNADFNEADAKLQQIKQALN